MKRNMQFLESKEEILNIPIGPNVGDNKDAEKQRVRIINGEDLNSIVHMTLFNNDINLLEFLFKNIDIDDIVVTYSAHGYNLLHYAACGGLEVLQFCLKIIKDIDPTATTTNGGNNILHLAARSGNVEAIDYIFKNIKDINPTVPNIDSNNILHLATCSGNIEAIDYILKNIKDINPTATTNDGSNILHFATKLGRLEVLKYILENIKDIGIDPTATTNDGSNILDLAVSNIGPTIPYNYSKKYLEAIKHILKTGIIDTAPDIFIKLISLTQENSPDFSNSISLIQNLLESKEEAIKVDFSKQKFDEDLLLKMFKHYVCKPQLAQQTVGEAKKLFMKKAEDNNLPETLIKAIPYILNEWAKEILYQERDLMSEDYELAYEYADLPLLIQHFNPEDGDDLVGLKKWFKNFPNLNKQLDDFIKLVKELQDFIESPDDKKEETKAELKQLVAKLKTNFTELVYDNVAGDYLNKLAKLPDDEILMKCIVNEHFAAALKSIKPLFLNTETQDKFSDIIEEYEVEKDKLKINFQDFIITEESGPNDDATDQEDKTPMGDYEPGLSFFE